MEAVISKFLYYNLFRGRDFAWHVYTVPNTMCLSVGILVYWML